MSEKEIREIIMASKGLVAHIENAIDMEDFEEYHFSDISNWMDKLVEIQSMSKDMREKKK